jgi:hypothetical protein
MYHQEKWPPSPFIKARKLKKGEHCCQHSGYVGIRVGQDKKRGIVVSTCHKDEMCSKVTKESKEET